MSRKHGHESVFFLHGVSHIIHIVVKNANNANIQP